MSVAVAVMVVAGRMHVDFWSGRVVHKSFCSFSSVVGGEEGS